MTKPAFKPPLSHHVVAAFLGFGFAHRDTESSAFATEFLVSWVVNSLGQAESLHYF